MSGIESVTPVGAGTISSFRQAVELCTYLNELASESEKSEKIHCQSFRRAHARNVITKSNFGESNCAEVDGLEHRPFFDLREDETWQENEENHAAREIDHLHCVNLNNLAIQHCVDYCHNCYQLKTIYPNF